MKEEDYFKWFVVTAADISMNYWPRQSMLLLDQMSRTGSGSESLAMMSVVLDIVAETLRTVVRARGDLEASQIDKVQRMTKDSSVSMVRDLAQKIDEIHRRGQKRPTKK